jgi:hypothetical protein
MLAVGVDIGGNRFLAVRGGLEDVEHAVALGIAVPHEILNV